MREIVELRVSEEVEQYLNTSLMAMAKRIGPSKMVTCIFELPSSDERWHEILEACDVLEREKKKERESARYILSRPNYFKDMDLVTNALRKDTLDRGWQVHPLHGYSWVVAKRFYTRKELQAAELLQIIPYVATQFDRKREDTALIYDLEGRCPMCLAASQKGELIFVSPKFPKAREIIQPMLYNETLISERLANLIQDRHITGHKIGNVLRRRRSTLESVPGWKQLTSTSEVNVDLEKTIFGYDFFHHVNTTEGSCKVCGATKGQGIQSEAFINRRSWDGSDFVVSRERLGGGTTMGYPLQMTFISQKLYRLLTEYDIKGYHLEVAHLT